MDPLGGKLAVRIRVIRSISPSTAQAFSQCKLSEAFRSADQAPRLPTHPKAHFGTIAHSILDQAQKGYWLNKSDTEIREELRSQVERYEAELLSNPKESAVVPLSKSCPDYEVNFHRLIATIIAIRPGSRPSVKTYSSPLKGGFEIKVSSADNLIVGRLDKVSWENSQPVVTDFKTGSIKNHDNEIHPAIRTQLLLYGYLVNEKFGKWPRKFILRNLSNQAETFELDQSESIELVKELTHELVTTNDLIESILQGENDEAILASPVCESCRLCIYRPTCNSYWTSRKKSPDERWPHDVSGEIIKIRSTGSKFSLVEVQDEDGKPRVVRGMPESAAFKLKPDHHNIRLCGLKSERAPGVFSWRTTTLIQ